MKTKEKVQAKYRGITLTMDGGLWSFRMGDCTYSGLHSAAKAEAIIDLVLPGKDNPIGKLEKRLSEANKEMEELRKIIERFKVLELSLSISENEAKELQDNVKATCEGKAERRY